MKKIILLFAVIVMSLSMAEEICAETVNKNDSIAKAVRLNSLQNRKESLRQEIKTQDAKRNKQISGVSAETLEEMNERQDSLCLALRSQLTDVILEIKELSPSVTSTQLVNQYNSLVNRKDSIAPASSQSPDPANRVNSKTKE